MKTTPNLTRQLVFALLIILILFSMLSCSDKCTVKSTYVYFKPVYTTTAELKASTGLKIATPLSAPGKIYLKDGNLFVNEIGKGIHLYDNSNPASPKALGFLNIPGNYDLAILGNILYADSYVDLVTFDVSDLTNIKEVNRLEGFFKNYNSMGFYSDPVKGIVTTWEKTATVSIQENDCAPSQLQNWGGMLYDGGIAVPQNYASNVSTTAAPTNLSTGVSGSMSRFTISKNFSMPLMDRLWRLLILIIQHYRREKLTKHFCHGQRLYSLVKKIFLWVRGQACPSLILRLRINLFC